MLEQVWRLGAIMLIPELPEYAIFVPIINHTSVGAQVYQRYLGRNWKLANHDGLHLRVGDPDEFPVDQLAQTLGLPDSAYWYDDELEDEYGDCYLIKYHAQ